ncbi:MAG: hypothetical protein WD609_16990, partial [Aquisalimonadaceae bacterium]
RGIKSGELGQEKALPYAQIPCQRATIPIPWQQRNRTYHCRLSPVNNLRTFAASTKTKQQFRLLFNREETT